MRDGVYPNLDIIGSIENYNYDQMNEDKPSMDYYFNLYLTDDQSNTGFIQAKGILGLGLLKYVEALGGLYKGKNKVIGLRNVEHSHGPFRSNTKLITFLFKKASEPYN